MTDSALIRALMARLIDVAGGTEAAARLIAARQGVVPDPLGRGDDMASRKGTISKRQAGVLEWPLVEIVALEDAVGQPLVRRWLAGQLPEVAASASLASEAGAAARESGEAVAAVLGLIGGQGDPARARAEVAEAMQALAALAARLDAGPG